MYSLMAPGLHGENGLDPETAIHLLKTYVILVLLYGLEINLPTANDLNTLEVQFKKIVKHILSLPVTVADPAPFILSGLIPAEGFIHLRALSLFGNVSRLEDSATERQLAIRQLCIKDRHNNSWFVHIRKICVQYDLPDPLIVLQDTPSKDAWKRQTQKLVYRYWQDRVVKQATTYTTLQHLSVDLYRPGKVHPLLHLGDYQNPVMQANRIPVKLKLVTGTYMLQSTRAAFNNIEIDPTCVLCKLQKETIEHFVLECPKLNLVRRPILEVITSLYREHFDEEFSKLSTLERLQFLLDMYASIGHRKRKRDLDILLNLEHHCRRLCYCLHVHRYKLMCQLPSRKRYGPLMFVINSKVGALGMLMNWKTDFHDF